MQIRQQCLDCGYVIGGSRKRAPGDENLPTIDATIGERYEHVRQAQFHEIRQRHARLQHEKSNSFFKEYGDYLRSDTWKAKRRLVFKRAGGVCEGCGLQEATEVHHLTYDHKMSEFLFELVAVCTECHARLHEDVTDDAAAGTTEVEGYDDQEFDDYYEEPCSGCRWSGYRDHRYWCELEDMAADLALAEDGTCGPIQTQFTGLK